MSELMPDYIQDAVAEATKTIRTLDIGGLNRANLVIELANELAKATTPMGKLKAIAYIMRKVKDASNECPTCNGRGEVSVPNSIDSGDFTHEWTDDEVCPTCNGTGKATAS